MQQLRNWLNQPEAELLREVLTSNIAIIQADIGQAILESVDNENRESVHAQNLARDGVEYVNALSVLQRFRDDENELIRVTLVPDLTIRTTPELTP